LRYLCLWIALKIKIFAFKDTLRLNLKVFWRLEVILSDQWRIGKSGPLSVIEIKK
jgi:hypothetical protein